MSFRQSVILSLIVLAMTLVAIATGIAHAQAAERRVALVIGMDSYARLDRLDNAVRDAELMAEGFRNLGFKVTLHRNLDNTSLKRALQTFEQEADQAEVAAIYFAGHGVAVDGRNWMLPVDAQVGSARHVDDEAVAHTRFIAAVDGAKELQIIILDACRTGLFKQRLAGQAGSRTVTVRGLEPIPERELPPNRLVAFSARDGQEAQDGPRGGNGPYASALRRRMTEGGTEIGLLFRRVRDDVLAATRNKQEPWTYSNLGGQELYLAPTSPGATPAPPGAEVVQLAFWQSIQSSRDVADFEAYLRRYPRGQFAELAQNQIARLRQPPSGQQAVLPQPVPAPVIRGFPVRVGQAFRDEGCPGGCPEMVVIPAGRFTMGSPAGEPGRYADEGPQRHVTLRTTLAVGKYHVTVGEYRAFVQATGRADGESCLVWDRELRLRPGRNWRNAGFPQTDRDPVVCVSWEDALAYAAWVSQQSRQRYRLLTEAEWEYAARAETTARWWWGDDAEGPCGVVNGADRRTRQQVLGTSHWTFVPCDDGFAYTAPVGRFVANRFGLHDMAGNAWQWVLDCYRGSYVGAPMDASTPVEMDNCTRHAQRGGSWGSSVRDLRSASRDSNAPGARSYIVGFRIGRMPSP